MGYLHHVVDEHSWLFGGAAEGGSCGHKMPMKPEDSNKPWLQKGSTAHDKLSEIMLNVRWLKSVHHYLTFRSVHVLDLCNSVCRMTLLQVKILK